MEKLQRLPLGVQDFRILREGNYLYVDKTSLIYELTQTNRAVFFSRPRRFGKSLLLSTIKYYFLGCKDLFRGLEIEKLGFPNAEVKYGFLNSLAPSYLHVEDKPAPFNIDILDDAVEEGNTDGMRDWFTALFALLPYPAGSDAESVTEQNFQNVIFMSLTMMGKYARTEVHSAKGRADCILETSDYVYIFEFKRDISASDALKQIEEQNYAKPYLADKRKLFKIGVNFSTAERNIVEWEVEEQ